ncbi:uncharacterized protein L3040_003140 [Drepanopeziza brunnea f. sp. 'multigermtubi']|uniref:uncharacterized protein n=1 Tax=Drepanopeziza brunnea f. sp. 'multigermtubi' TaxID=698441 RepID=UPI00238CE89F|nr:hypothetical protein L3040_003140 [Drepanopeziza brunnea f. sp. 'multigermtubi']
MALRSDRGLVLGPEVCLDIATALIDSDPKAIRSLLCLSKEFYSLLTAYERSISRSLLKINKDKFAYANSQQAEILSSRTPPGNAIVSVLTFPWVLEMKSRVKTIDFLVGHEITEMSDYRKNWPTLDLPNADLGNYLTKFKKSALLLLYKLVDYTAGLTEINVVRSRQAEFLDGLSSIDLASIGVLVEVIGEGFFTMTKGDLHRSGLLNNIPTQLTSDPRLFTPTSTHVEDLHNDHWLQECMCVFEDLVQRYGPYFAYAFLEKSRDAPRRPDLWTRSMLQQGLDNMNAFEMGYTMSYASLQSVVWRKFCKKANCTLEDSWRTAQEMVETQMAEYKV